MTDISKETIAAMLDGVTPGPWEFEELATVYPNGDVIIDAVEVNTARKNIHAHDLGYDDGPVDAAIVASARFIAYAREAVPALAAERDDLAAQLARSEANFHRMKELCVKAQDGLNEQIDKSVALAARVAELEDEVDKWTRAWGTACENWQKEWSISNFRAEAAEAEVARLRDALILALSTAENWILDQLEGTGQFKRAWAELDPARAALQEKPE